MNKQEQIFDLYVAFIRNGHNQKTAMSMAVAAWDEFTNEMLGIDEQCAPKPKPKPQGSSIEADGNVFHQNPNF